jgi:predicted enzyme related to lactoylglutathione lyase
VERATGIGGVFVRSPHPDALRAWYAEHLGLELQATDPDGNRFELWEPAAGQ